MSGVGHGVLQQGGPSRGRQDGGLVASILAKLDLRESTEHRRVLAVLTWLGVRPGAPVVREH